MKLFERDGVRFRYPANWVAETGDDPGAGDGGWSVTVQSPESAFLLVSLRPEADTPDCSFPTSVAEAEPPGLNTRACSSNDSRA